MVESESARDVVEAGAHELDGLLESLLNLRHGEAVESGEVRRLREVHGQAAQQPVACEVVSPGREAVESLLHLTAHGGPFRADLGEREVALAKLRAARVHAVEDIHDYVDGFVRAGHGLGEYLSLLDLLYAVEPREGQLEGRAAKADGLLDAEGFRYGSGLVDLGYRDPHGVALHLGGTELEYLILDVEHEVGECVLVALEERWLLATHDAVERRHALLAVENEVDDTLPDDLLALDIRVFHGSLPQKHRAHRIALVQRRHEFAHLRAVPHVAALELRHRIVARVDAVEDVGYGAHR